MHIKYYVETEIYKKNDFLTSFQSTWPDYNLNSAYKQKNQLIFKAS